MVISDDLNKKAIYLALDAAWAFQIFTVPRDHGSCEIHNNTAPECIITNCCVLPWPSRSPGLCQWWWGVCRGTPSSRHRGFWAVSPRSHAWWALSTSWAWTARRWIWYFQWSDVWPCPSPPPAPLAVSPFLWAIQINTMVFIFSFQKNNVIKN